MVWGFHLPYSYTVLSLWSIITASMSTEIIAQIDFPTPFATLPLRFKCPAMCCSQTARTPRLRHFPPGQSALPEIITQLAFLSSGGPRRRGRTDVVQLSPHLIYIICASFCLPWPATQLSTCVHLALLVAHCPSVCLSAGRLVGWSVGRPLLDRPFS